MITAISHRTKICAEAIRFSVAILPNKRESPAELPEYAPANFITDIFYHFMNRYIKSESRFVYDDIITWKN